jgi:hypothetical protein
MTAVGQTRKSVTATRTSAFGVKADVDFGRLKVYYVDPYGKHLGYEDVFIKIDMCRAHFENVGLGADFVQQFIR